MRGGETLRYANLVRDIIPVGRWSGKAGEAKAAAAEHAQYDGVVVLLQAGTPERPGAILGATRIPLRGTLSDLHRTGFGVRVSRATRPTRHAVYRAA